MATFSALPRGVWREYDFIGGGDVKGRGRFGHAGSTWGKLAAVGDAAFAAVRACAATLEVAVGSEADGFDDAAAYSITFEGEEGACVCV